MPRLLADFSLGLLDGVVTAAIRSTVIGGVALVAGVMIARDAAKPPVVVPEPVDNPVFNAPITTAGVEFHVLSGGCRWVLGSVSDIVCNGVAYEGSDLIESHLPPSLADKLNHGADLVSIGAASSEGLPEREKERAQVRANNMAKWVSDRLHFKGNAWVINLGQFKGACPDCQLGDSSAQRPVILATIAHQDDAEAVRELVRRELVSGAIKTGSIILSPDNYAQFEIQKLK